MPESSQVRDLSLKRTSSDWFAGGLCRSCSPCFIVAVRQSKVRTCRYWGILGGTKLAADMQLQHQQLCFSRGPGQLPFLLQDWGMPER